MSAKSEDPVVFYAPLPSRPDYDQDPQNYVVLPLYGRLRRRRPNRLCRYISLSAIVLFLLAAAAFLLFPSDPTLTLTRLRLHRIDVRTSPTLSLSLSLRLTLRIFNPDFFALNYSSLSVSIGYRGQKLGNVTSQGGRVRARGTSYVNAILELDGIQVIYDVVYLIEDLAKGSIPFDTDSVVKGNVRLFFIEIPIKARIECEVYVNTKNETITHQDCYPK